MAQKPFLALVIPAAETHGGPPGTPPGHGGTPPGQGGMPPGQMRPEHPIVIEPPPDIPELQEGSKLVLVWDGDAWRWAVTGIEAAQPIQPTPEPKRGR